MTNKYFLREMNRYIEKLYASCEEQILSGNNSYDYCDQFYVEAFSDRCYGVLQYLSDKNWDSKNTNWNLPEPEIMDKIRDLKMELFQMNFNFNWGK